MAATPETLERILDGALRALARRGIRKLSMSDIGAEAGVSRGTLYRYFRSKDQVLEAIGTHVKTGFVNALTEAVDGVANPRERLRRALDVVVHYPDAHPESILALEVEPAFAIAFLRREFPEYVKALRKALKPVFAATPAIQDGSISETDMTDLLQRLAMSAFLLPSEVSPRVPELVAQLWPPTDSAGSTGHL